MPQKLRQIFGPVLYGLIFFVGLMGISQGLVALNAAVSPALPWFPLPALLLLALVIIWVNRSQPLRLEQPVGMRTYVTTLLLTYGVLCVGVFESWWHALTLPAPTWPNPSVSTGFQLTFVLVLPFIAAVLAEVGFRGLMQGALEKVMTLWPMLGLLAVLNFLMHFYDPEQADQIVRLLLLNLVWGYMTWRVQSIRPALAAHILMNIVVPLLQYRSEFFGSGPVAFGEFSAVTLSIIAVTGIAATLGGLLLLKELRPVAANATD